MILAKTELVLLKQMVFFNEIYQSVIHESLK